MFTELFKKLTHIFTGSYNILMCNLILLFIFRPNTQFIYLGIWKVLLSFTLLIAIFNCHHKHKVKVIAFILLMPNIFLSLIRLWLQQEFLFVLNCIVTILFMSIVTGSILYDVILRARVTLETLRGVICAYFLIAFAFAYLYYLIEFLTPNSFHLVYRVTTFSYTHYLSELLYFSFITLLTIGFGDITAITAVAQTAVVIEGIIGQFYIAMLVARIVSVYTFFSEDSIVRQLKEHKKESEYL